jgi:hypothetical protein
MRSISSEKRRIISKGLALKNSWGLSEKSEGIHGPRRDSPPPCHPCPPLCIAIDSEPDCVS